LSWDSAIFPGGTEVMKFGLGCWALVLLQWVGGLEPYAGSEDGICCVLGEIGRRLWFLVGWGVGCRCGDVVLCWVVVCVDMMAEGWDEERVG
jgi:hypothetical protein